MRTIILIVSLYLTTIVYAELKNPSLDMQNSAFQQQLMTALTNSLQDRSVQQKIGGEIGKYVAQKLINSLREFNVSSNCVTDLAAMFKGISEGQYWAIQMLDSFGKLPSGITRGTVGSLGDYDTCLGVTVQQLNKKSTQFHGKYCLVNFSPGKSKTTEQAKYIMKVFNRSLEPMRHMRRLQPQTAICIPSSCTKDDVQNVLLTVMPILGIDARVRNCDTINDEIKISSSEKLLIFFLSTLFVIVIVSTFHHLIKEFTNDQASEKEEENPDGFLQHFSMLRNAQRLFKRENNTDSIRIFHGIRVLTTLWLIPSHILTVMYDQPYGGLYAFFSMRKSIWAQFIPSSSIAVETFFFMSAVLLAYNITKNKDLPITVSLAFQRRYVRTTISLFLVIACIILLPHLSSGPLYKEIIGNEAENCKQLGWINLFYIQNFIPYQRMCMAPSWYLAADMQLFLLSLFILIPFRKNSATLIKLIVALLFLGILGKVIGTILFKLPPTFLMLDPTFENFSYVWQRSYFSPVFHLSTYSIGLLVGYMLASNIQIKMSNISSAILWITSILIQLCIVFGVFVWNREEEPPELMHSLLFGASHRILWSLTLAWITISCHRNDKSIISRFLGAEAFVPLSRLTYMAYLINFTINHLYIATTRNLIIYDFWTMGPLVVALTTITFIISAILTLIFESPFLSLEKALLKKVVKRKNLKKVAGEKNE